jgi:hypothetical protein
MTTNSLPCKQCVHFDQKYKGSPDGIPRPAWYGWCAVRSVYPHQELEGQVFPSEVKRAAHGQVPKPFVVKADGVVGFCLQGMKKP